ncbi:MAG: DUF4249 domain-containing protein [Parafilimonas sp.]
MKFFRIPYYYLILSALLLSACEREINLTVNIQPPKLVVDASIEDSSFPTVVLSKSLQYFSTISPEELAASFVHDAVVTISNDYKTVQLKEYPYTDSSGYTVYYYTIDLNDPSSYMIGNFNTAYDLKIQTTDCEIYTAHTTIPLVTKTCDSLWWKPAPAEKDTAFTVLYGRFTDPPGLGNYVRYFTRVNSQPFYPGFTSAFDDEVVDGTTYDFQIPRGFNKADTVTTGADDFGFFRYGDTVTFKFCNIDKATYDFWRTWEFSYQSNGNPFSSPAVVIGNISNNALGAFCGYAAQFRTIIIPK